MKIKNFLNYFKFNLLFSFFSKLIHFSEFEQTSSGLEENNQQLLNMFDDFVVEVL